MDVLEWGPDDGREGKMRNQNHVNHDLRYLWTTKVVEYLRGFEIELSESFSQLNEEEGLNRGKGSKGTVIIVRCSGEGGR